MATVRHTNIPFAYLMSLNDRQLAAMVLRENGLTEWAIKEALEDLK